MSMQTTIIYGFGFEAKRIELSKAIEFIYNHKDAIKEHYSSFAPEFVANVFNNKLNESNAEEILPETGNGCDWDVFCMACDVIANIMKTETNIGFQYEMGQEDCYSEPCIILPETLPWYMNETEKNLTYESIIKIIKKYLDELNISNENICCQHVEYFG